MTTARIGKREQEQGRKIFARVEDAFKDEHLIFDRMDDDYDLYTLKGWQPDEEDSISPEDAYTTNAPRVLAEKIISFISQTNATIRVPNDLATKDQEQVNENTEQLAIGMLANVDRRLRRRGKPVVQDQLAWYSVVRGRYAAARAVLRVRPNGDTFEDILPLDPRHLVIQSGDEEPVWAAYRMYKTRNEIRDEFPNFKFDGQGNRVDQNGDDGRSTETVYEYYVREPNPDYSPDGDVFQRHPWRYMIGTLVDHQWIRKLHNVFTLGFPVVISPVTAQPSLAPDGSDVSDISDDGAEVDATRADFGESIFAENRKIWDKQNRITSYLIDLTAKASNPRTKVFSLDGTTALEDGVSDKGSEINLSTANQEDIQNFIEADINRATGLLENNLNLDSVGGGLPPQAVGLLDKPLSSVALRQLGLNLEQKVVPRMNAVAACLEGCLEILIGQYETGAFNQITVSGRRFDNQKFANRQITADDIVGHDPISVGLVLALPEDDTVRWSIAQMAMQPTVTGEPLGSLEHVREHILKFQSSKVISDQNRQILGSQASPVVQLLELYKAAVEDGDEMKAAALFDQLQIAALQTQVQGSMQMLQLMQMAQGMPPMTAVNQQSVGQQIQSIGGNNQLANPGFGAVPNAAFTGIGNQPSPQAGFNTTAPRQRDTGLVDPAGEQIFSQ